MGVTVSHYDNYPIDVNRMSFNFERVVRLDGTHDTSVVLRVKNAISATVFGSLWVTEGTEAAFVQFAVVTDGSAAVSTSTAHVENSTTNIGTVTYTADGSSDDILITVPVSSGDITDPVVAYDVTIFGDFMASDLEVVAEAE